MSTKRTKCETCNIKIPKRQPKLVCDVCNSVKHLRCQKLTKSDASLINFLRIKWTCSQCIKEILPINCTGKPKFEKTNSVLKFKAKCTACSGYSYSERNVRICSWCDGQVHAKCWKENLGCISCCEKMIPGYHAFSYELFDSLNGRKNDAIHNPYSSEHFTMQIGNMIDTELENNNFWSEISDFLVNCKYMQAKNIKAPSENEFDIFSLNIRSLYGKIGHFRANISQYQKHDILLFNETNTLVEKLPHGINDLLLDGFHEPLIAPPKRSSGKGGGLAIYVNTRVCDNAEDIKPFDPNPDPENTSGEFQFIKLLNCKNNKRTVVVGNIYRSPSRKPEAFNEHFETILQRLNRFTKNKICYLVGDFNQDLIKFDSDANYQNLIDATASHGLVQIVSRPTRITDKSATLIDHVYTNNLENTLSCNILTLDLSDHLAIHTRVLLSKNKIDNVAKFRHQSETKVRDIRIFNDANNETFNSLINTETWTDITDDMDAQKSYDKFHETYIKHYEAAYPLKSQRIRRQNERQDPKPWILPWLEDACARKKDFYHEFVKEPTPANKIKYDKMKAFCEKHTDKAKAKYQKKYFAENRENSKKQWQMINTLLGRKKSNKSVKKLIKNDGSIVNCPKAIAENFNDYFSNIAKNMKEKTCSVNNQNRLEYDKFLENPVAHSIYLDTVTPGEVHSVIKNFKNKSTLDIRICSLKVANDSTNFTQALAKVIEKSFKEGIFPDRLKSARVVPVHKEGKKTDVENYRPISLLASISKIYEKLMHKRIIKFLDSNESLSDLQYGFRSGRSCEHALLKAQNVLLDSLSKKQISLLLLIDFSKAFDMVEHPILLKKLEHYGIRGMALKWMTSYLHNRTQFVSIDGADSTSKPMLFGVPQGSILGPLLFIIYINDLPNIFKAAKFILYADDANIIIQGPDIATITQQLRNLFDVLPNWVSCNGLALNLKKTKYMIFSRKNVDLTEDLKISNTKIERIKEAKFLGVIVDEKLNWSAHIKTLQSKMSRYIGIMYRLKKLLPIQVRIQIYQSFIQSHVNYCSLVWGFASKSHIDSLFRKQKKGIRAIVPGFINYKYREGELPGHTKPYFKEYKILAVQGVIVANALLFMCKIRKFPSFLPLSIRQVIDENAPVPGSTYETCHSWLAAYGGNTHRKSIFFKGPLLSIMPSFAELTTPGTSPINIESLKRKIKTIMLDVQASGENAEWTSENFVINCIPGLRSSSRVNSQ